MADQSSDDVRLGQVCRMSAPGNQGGSAPGRGVGQAECVGSEPGVICSGEGQKGRSEVGYAVPQRLLRAGAGQAQARGQTRCGVAQPLVGLGRIGQTDEHRAADPPLDEGLDVPRLLECVGGAPVGLSAFLAGHRVLDAARAADQDEATDIEIRARHDVKSDTCAERVAEEVTTVRADRGDDRIAHQGSGPGQIGADSVRSSVTGQVEGDEDMVLRQQIAEGSPQTRRLGESVQQNNRRSGSPSRVVRHGVARMVSVQATFAATLVDEWVHAGITDAVICPGSRSTPMALALAARLRVHVRLDERSAGFFALGLAMATGRPPIICVTSGTAAAELHPAVVEAHQGRVPLIVCTADRPPELHHVGASQTIDQIGLFTTSTRWASNPGVPEEVQVRWWRPLAARAFAEAQTGPSGPGPVHLNLAFREPLLGDAGPLPARPGPISVARQAESGSLDTPLGGRGMIIAGANATADPAQLLLLGARLGWPILADPRSGCRVPGTIAAADAIVGTTARPELPDTVVLLGAPWLSKELGEYVAQAAAQGRASFPSIPGGSGRTPMWS